MSRVNLDDLDKYVGGGSSFFKLNDGDKKNVRFLYNTVEEVKAAAMVVHEFTGDKFATIDCNRASSEGVEECKWCAMGNNPVMRVILPIYVEDSGEIQYWKKSGSFVKDTLLPMFENLTPGAPISGQIFILGRTGKTMTDTKYTCAVNMKNPNDMKTKDQFGEVKDPMAINMVKPYDYNFDPMAAPAQQATASQTAVRRTTDVF